MIRFRSALLGLLTGLILFGTVQLYRTELRRSAMKHDLKELSHIAYGLFNVDEWKKILSGIVTTHICSLEITPMNRAKLKGQFEGIMYRMVDELEKVMRKKGNSTGLNKMMRNILLDVFVDIDRIKSGVPGYADMVLDYLNDPKNREELQLLVLQQFDQLTDKTVGRVDYSEVTAICERYGHPDSTACRAYLQVEVVKLEERGHVWLYLLLGACATMLIVLWAEDTRPAQLILMVIAAAGLLVAGVALPMIDIEAAISTFRFTLMGAPVEFNDQVLFYQSKSILEVVHVLVADGEVGLVLVGCLILLFSVIFPLAKLIASLITLVRKREPTNTVHRFLVYKSGKWSMADVMVVAIFMAYIGFSGVVNNQMQQLERSASSIELLTTNNSGLQLGFFIFLTYCITGLLLATRIQGLAAIERLPSENAPRHG